MDGLKELVQGPSLRVEQQPQQEPSSLVVGKNLRRLTFWAHTKQERALKLCPIADGRRRRLCRGRHSRRR